jgi:hypothetical protein
MRIKSKSLRLCLLHAGPYEVQVDADGHFDIADEIGKILVNGIPHEYYEVVAGPEEESPPAPAPAAEPPAPAPVPAAEPPAPAPAPAVEPPAPAPAPAAEPPAPAPAPAADFVKRVIEKVMPRSAAIGTSPDSASPRRGRKKR